MIYKCASCQFEVPEQLPPAPKHPEYCPRCRSTSFVAVHSTEPPPPAPDTLPDGAPAPGSRTRVLLSTMLYSLSKELGADSATAELHSQLEQLEGPTRVHRHADGYLPVALTITRARQIFDVGLLVDAGGTIIGKARSRLFSEFLRKPEFNVWLSCDDDTDCTLGALSALVEAVSDEKPSIAIAPTWLRGVERVNVAFTSVLVDRTLVHSGAKLRRCYYGGFGLVAMNKAAAQIIAAGCDQFDDDDGRLNTAAFADIFARADGRRAWLSEDLSFFARVPSQVRVEALISGHTRHGGVTLPLERVATGEAPTLQATPEWFAAHDHATGETTGRALR